MEWQRAHSLSTLGFEMHSAVSRRSTSTSLPFPRRDVRTQLGYAVEKQALEAGELVRMQRRLDELRGRIGEVGEPEGGSLVRSGSRLSA